MSNLVHDCAGHLYLIPWCTHLDGTNGLKTLTDYSTGQEYTWAALFNPLNAGPDYIQVIYFLLTHYTSF